MGEHVDSDTGGQMHWEFAKLYWDGPEPGSRRLLWFSHRDPVEFAPEDYEDVLWQLGETGFEPVGYQAFPRPDGDSAAAGWGPATAGVREITLFKRPLGTNPTPAAH